MKSTRAHLGLESTDVVLGPSADGGYWLIGLRRPQARLFQGVTWSTEHVFAQTLEIAKQENLSLKILEEKTDIDTIDAWNAFRNVHS